MLPSGAIASGVLNGSVHRRRRTKCTQTCAQIHERARAAGTTANQSDNHAHESNQAGRRAWRMQLLLQAAPLPPILPGGARGSLEEPGGARRSQEEPG